MTFKNLIKNNLDQIKEFQIYQSMLKYYEDELLRTNDIINITSIKKSIQIAKDKYEESIKKMNSH